MQAIATIGLDIAKSVFQVHGVDAAGQVVVRRQLKRRYVLAFFQKLPPCLIGIEACASSHHWSRAPLDSPAVVRLNRYPSAQRPQPCLGRVALSGRTSKGTRMEEAGPTPSSRQRRGRPVRIGIKRAIIDRN